MYLDGFENIEDLKKQYEITDQDLEGIDLLYASYGGGCYDGSSVVFFKKEDKLYIFEAGHCSCYGLEGQWSPVETCEEALRKEIEAKSNYRYEEFESFIDFCYGYFKWEKP